MLARLRRHRVSRVIAILTLSVLASARAAASVVACEAVTPHPAQHAASLPAMAGMDMAQSAGDKAQTSSPDGSDDKDRCDAPQGTAECALMVACAPALSASTPSPDVRPASEPSATGARSRAPAPVDRAPEPPPPRA